MLLTPVTDISAVNDICKGKVYIFSFMVVEIRQVSTFGLKGADELVAGHLAEDIGHSLVPVKGNIVGCLAVAVVAPVRRKVLEA